jgi:hypothetical protein
MSMDAILCKKQTRQLNRLSPAWAWGLKLKQRYDAGHEMRESAKALEREAESLEKYCVHFGLCLFQRAAVLRTARQIRETAERIRREAGEAAWLGADYNVVDLANAKPVTSDRIASAEVVA